MIQNRQSIQNNKTPPLRLRLPALLLAIGIFIGFLVSSYLRPNLQDYKIEYISQEEILNLEKERAKSANATDLFFGKSADAIGYIEEVVKQKEAHGSKVVFATEGIISGNNVISISKEVYQLVIQRLQAENPNYNAGAGQGAKPEQESAHQEKQLLDNGVGTLGALHKSGKAKDGWRFKQIRSSKATTIQNIKEEEDVSGQSAAESEYDDEDR